MPVVVQELVTFPFRLKCGFFFAAITMALDTEWRARSSFIFSFSWLNNMNVVSRLFTLLATRAAPTRIVFQSTISQLPHQGGINVFGRPVQAP